MKTKKKLMAIGSLLTVGSLLMPTSACMASQTNIALTINTDASALDASSKISPYLYGIFLEDINFAVDGGMYAQMIKNGSFEYGMLAKNQGQHNYSLSNKETVTLEVVDGSADGTCLNENNPHYALITNTSDNSEGIGNKGYLEGLALQEGASYKFSAFLKGLDGYTGPVEICVSDKSDTVIAQATIPDITEEWTKYECTFTSSATMNKTLRIWLKIGSGKVAADMLSLFPEDTYKGRENGIRKDIGEYLEALHPKFLRFPGGCAIEGTSDFNQYSWKDSIGNGLSFTINGEETTGDVAARPIGVDIWHSSQSDPYYMTYGLGFYEYFLLCEDLNCLPVPVLNAGMVCPIHSGEGYTYFEEDSEEFKAYVQDALDLVEFCRGGADTKWGAVRIAMGHEEPFELHYIGIGNEQWQDEYYSHFDRFKEAFAQAAEENPDMYGDLELIVANGPASTDRFAWDVIAKNGSDYAGLVDEHYYETPDWFLENVDRYDSYDRESVPVFLGEYAAKSNTMEAALAEAAYMTGLEENGDIVKLSCYAPLFGNFKSNQWEPDMIFFSNDSLYGTVNYYVQKMFSNNQGTKVLESTLSEDSQGLYQVSSTGEDGSIIVKLVNVTEEEKAVDITLENGDSLAASANVTVLKAESKDDLNNMMNPDNILPEESTLEVSSQFTYNAPKYSVSVIVIPQA